MYGGLVPGRVVQTSKIRGYSISFEHVFVRGYDVVLGWLVLMRLVPSKVVISVGKGASDRRVGRLSKS